MPSANADVLYGRRPVQLFLEKSPRRARRLFIDRRLSRDIVEKFSRLARGRSAPIALVDSGQIDRLSDGGVHQGVALEADPLRLRGISDLLSLIKHPSSPPAQGRSNFPAVFLALDSVTDPQNFGAVARSADAFGLGGLVFESRHAPPFGGAAYKASAGAIEFVPLFSVSNFSETLRTIKSDRVRIVGLDAGGKSPLGDCLAREDVRPHALVLVLGSEGRGIQKSVKSLCTEICSIPMSGHVGSLNVSAAAAVACYIATALSNARAKIGLGSVASSG